MNDIIDEIESEILLFADDTCCFATGIDPAEKAIILNRDLEMLNTWAFKGMVHLIYKLYLIHCRGAKYILVLFTVTINFEHYRSFC